MRQSRIRHLRLQNLFEVFFPFQFFTLALLLSVALRWVFYLKNIFPFLLKTPWQFFKSLVAELVKLYFDSTFLLFSNSVSLLRQLLGLGRDLLLKYVFSSILHFIAASVTDIMVLRMSGCFPCLGWKAQVNQDVLSLSQLLSIFVLQDYIFVLFYEITNMKSYNVGLSFVVLHESKHWSKQ